MKRMITAALTAAAILSTSALAQDINSQQALADLRTLSADDMDGRRTGTQGAADARDYVAERFFMTGLVAFGDTYEQAFTYTPRIGGDELDGINLIGFHGQDDGEGPVLVVTAHYDHIGHCGGAICNGADDNASGVAAMLAIAEVLRDSPPDHLIIFAALDAEENGLNGARALVANLPVEESRVALNINLDMLAINAENELPAAGAFHFPFLRAHIDAVEVAEPTHIIQGYDSPEWGPGGDWTNSSDHAAFHHAGIPWIYYGVDFHEHYHQPTDEFEVVQQDFFLGNAQTVMNAVRYFDANLETVMQELVLHNASAASGSSADEAGDVTQGYTDEDGRYIKPGME